jgi:phosphoribosyl-ATP pyrophosphohydrolase
MSERFAEVIARLEATIASRKGADPQSSYTAKLLGGGPDITAKKFGEEAIETALAAVKGDPDHVAAESADLIYHWLVLLSSVNVSLDEVAAKLETREGTSGITEKASRRGR